MEIIKYIIVDEDEKARETLIKKVEICNIPELICSGLVSGIQEAKFLINDNQPDIVILNISLPCKNEIKFIQELKSNFISPELIITTVPSEFKIIKSTLKIKPVGYLKKPVDSEELSNALKKATKRIKQKKVLSSNLIRIKMSGCKGPTFIKPEKIAWIKANGHAAIVYLEQGDKEKIKENIGNLEKRLPSIFFRADRSRIVNLDWVITIEIKKKICIARQNDTEYKIPLSRNGIKRLLQRLESYCVHSSLYG